MNNLNIKEFYRQVGLKIREARELHKKNITQDTLARAVGLSRTSIVNIEQGRQHIQVHTLLNIAKHLDIPVNTLIPEFNFNLVDTMQILTKSVDLKETKSIEKALFLIANKNIELNVKKNKKYSKQNLGKN